MYALLEPFNTLLKYEEEGKNFERLAFLELLKTMPFGAVYDYYCMKNEVPAGREYIEDIVKYENEVLRKR
jgi:L-rhamnose isomerase